jgi:hypothetical protein
MYSSSDTLLGYGATVTGDVVSGLLDCIGTWFDLVHAQTNHPRDKGTTIRLLMNVVSAVVPDALSDDELEACSRCLSVLVDHSKARLVSNPLKRLVDPILDGLDDRYQLGEYEVGTVMLAVMRQLSRLCWSLICITLDGHLAVGNHKTQEMDILVAFQGCSFAAILRPWEDGFRYVGAAYLRDIGSIRSTAEHEWFTLI